MTRLLIFDLDGTLLNTIADLGEACNKALAANGFPVHSQDEYPLLVGNGVNKLIERALPLTDRNEETILRLRETFIPYYDAHNCLYTKPYEGIQQVLNSLKSSGFRLAVASNKYQRATEKLITHYFGDGLFDAVLGERDGHPRKPDPIIVEEIKAATGLSDSVCFIGDSEVDMQTARNAAVTSIACTWGFCKEEQLLKHTPHYIARQPEELLTIAEEIQRL